MKISFFSNYLNHHQIPFSNEMYKLLADDYKFIATQPMQNERIKQGWSIDQKYPYEIKCYESNADYNKCLNLGLESDVVIIGSAPDEFIEKRLKLNKLTFRYSERFFKKSAIKLFNPRMIGSMFIHHIRYRNKKLYLLCASAYAAKDAALIGAYPKKTYRWGYFPEVKKYDIKDLLNKKNKNFVTLLWCGRFIDLKHPEKAIVVMKRLIEKGFDCSLNLIGDGPIVSNIKEMVISAQLCDKVNFMGSMRPPLVREFMEKADIFLFTSDRQEGWGAVLNESMNSGCAVVASEEIGSVPFLIKNGENGLIYKNNNDDDLYKNVETLVKNYELRMELGYNAIQTMSSLWNPQIASQRLVELCEGLLNNKIIYFEDGPCSKI